MHNYVENYFIDPFFSETFRISKKQWQILVIKHMILHILIVD